MKVSGKARRQLGDLDLADLEYILNAYGPEIRELQAEIKAENEEKKEE
jgi:hypothetical protein